MKRTITALLSCLLLAGCATAQAEPSDEVAFAHVGDIVAEHHAEADEAARYEQLDAMAAERAETAAREAEAALEAAQWEGAEGGDAWSGSAYSGPAYTRGNPDGLNSYDGVYEYGGRVESWYPSSAGMHKDTWMWHEDEDGFYRTDEGYYVVASDDYEPGTVIETSQGQAQVLDSFTDDRSVHDAVDFYVNW